MNYLLSHASGFIEKFWTKSNIKNEVFIFIVTGLSAYYMLAVLSYHPLDNSPFSIQLPRGVQVNLAGNWGATLSGSVIHYLGVLAFFVPLPICIWIFQRSTNKKRYNYVLHLLGWTVGFTMICYLLTKFVGTLQFKEFELPIGGSVGNGTLSYGHNNLGVIGSMILAIASLLISMVLIFQRSILTPLTNIYKYEKFSGLYLKSTSWLKEKFRGSSPVEIDESENKDSVHVIISEHETQALTSNQVSPENYASPSFEIYEPYQNTSPENHEAIEESTYNYETTKNEISDDIEDGDEAPQKYIPPNLDLLKHSLNIANSDIELKDLEETAALLIRTFNEFNLKGEIIAVQPGPVVTVFEFRPDAGVKLAKVLGLVDDLALALRVDSIFINPVPGKRALGIQVPNTKRSLVLLGDIISSSQFQSNVAPLTFGMGKAIDGTPYCCDLAKMPHLLIAGATGAGKSVAINSLLCSILMKSGPEDVKLLLVDPKMLELSVYEGIPHLLMPVITEPSKAGATLRWAVMEMEKRYKIMQKCQVRNIDNFNEFWLGASTSQKTGINDFIEEELGCSRIETKKLPFILIVIDELADLMLTAPKEIESLIQRLAQKARASGIHLVLATQRPSVDVITGVIKANLPSRVSFQVVSKHDSRTILDQVGAEKLLGKGDMLMQIPGKTRLKRIQGAFVDDNEVIGLVSDLKDKWSSTYDNEVMDWVEQNSESGNNGSAKLGSSDDDVDSKFEQAIDIAANTGSVSASFLQRQLKIGYNRAARIVENMEARGFVGPAEGSKPRKWLGPNNDYE